MLYNFVRGMKYDRCVRENQHLLFQVCDSLHQLVLVATSRKKKEQQFNPTDDAFWCRQILAVCYQLAQSVLKIGSALAERVGQGEVGVPLWLTVHGGSCRCL